MSQTNKLSEETYETLLNYNVIETEEDDNIYLITEDEIIQNLENKIDNLSENIIISEEKINQILDTLKTNTERYIVSPSDDLLETIIDSEVSFTDTSTSSGYSSFPIGELQIVGFSGLIKITASIYSTINYVASNLGIYITKEGVSTDAFVAFIYPTSANTYQTISKNIPVNDGDIINFSMRLKGNNTTYKCNLLKVFGTITKLNSPYGVIKIS